jgi:hypothetical protein
MKKRSPSYGQNGQLVPWWGAAGSLWPGVRTSWTVEILNCSRPLFQDLTKNQDLDTAELEIEATKAFALRCCVRLPFSFPLRHRSLCWPPLHLLLLFLVWIRVSSFLSLPQSYTQQVFTPFFLPSNLLFVLVLRMDSYSTF